jgi:N-acetylglucosaminyl-diphospho-decaprenol L-rhamnosyltransferase
MILPKTTAVVVTYHSADTIGACLDGLKPAHHAGLLEAVVVDNDSQDETAEIVRRDHGWAQLVETGQNLGYGRGCNRGLAVADTPYVLFMNPDVTLSEGSLRAMLGFIQAHPQVGMTAPAIERERGGLQDAGPLPTPASILRAAAGVTAARDARRLIEPGSPAFQSPWLCGAIMLCRKAAVDRIAGFDPRFFLYFEETDLCLRLARAGYELWAVGEAVATHAGNSSARKVDPELEDGDCLSEHFYRSRYYYLVKHHGWLAATVAEFGELLLGGVRDVARRLRGKGNRSVLRQRLQGPAFCLPKRVVP